MEYQIVTHERSKYTGIVEDRHESIEESTKEKENAARDEILAKANPDQGLITDASGKPLDDNTKEKYQD